MDREISANHDNLLRRMCGITDQDPLPKKVTDSYWSFKICADRGGIPMLPGDLVGICVECGYGKLTKREAAGPDVVQMFRTKQIKSGDAVVVQWREKTYEGKLVTVTLDSKVCVLLKGDPQEHLVDVNDVSLPKVAA